MSGEKLGTWALISGIVSVVFAFFSIGVFFLPMCCCWLTLLGSVIALTAIILGIISLVMGAGEKKSSAIMGIVFGVLYWIIVFIVWIIGVILGISINIIGFIVDLAGSVVMIL